MVAKPGIVYALTFDRGNPRASIVLAATISAWVESRPPETPIAILDIPEEVKSVVLEYADPIGPWGVRGMAEMPFLPMAAAISAAVHDATGVWINAIPMTPERVVAALRREGVGIL